ncbi:Cytidine deaminase protein [Marine Group I thaumarchaeote SCGC AAA799-B03]|uniref:Cytidine deaminase protein n=3 Tax=Marine Group I TaxID=905826 RepID=A0A087S5X7_9ARCH|nr:Cytidine deaminase protein [Marine Group I thaumarchaeote SCGC AAA799-N04]KFM15807.1 Cytidine deaminase protein [Marine Group I thaumarchaeote SCGC RSA3]KFM21131.1 Cytidine deaminase protein [Marine Group I thaumarchaeote SCGC AAA799-B03]
MKIGKDDWNKLSKIAWEFRGNSRILGTTKVGCAVLSGKKTFGGCNIEHKFRSHDIHAEISAISSMVSAGEKKLDAILIVAQRKKFTPCGGCLDWIFEFGGENSLVGYQTTKNGDITIFKAKELMPHYPS